MNRVINIKETDDQKVYFTSDWHLGHQREFIWEVRGFKSYEDHTNTIINKTNEIVKYNDILFYLGDFSLNIDEKQFEEFISRINCQNIYFIFGNHNSPSWKIYQNEVRRCMETTCTSFELEAEVYPFRYRNLIFIGNYAEIIIHGHFIVATHYPLVSWNKMKKGSWNLFGHCHNKLNLDGKRIDVGWDQFQKPVSFQELQKIMGNKPIISDGGHH